VTQKLDFEYVLSAARRTLTGVSNFSYGDFAEAVLHELVDQNAIEPPSGPFNSYHDMHLTLNQRNSQLEFLLVQVFEYMYHREFFVPSPNAPNAPSMSRLYMTERGHEWLESGDPSPEDGRGYMKFLKTAVPNLDGVVEQYIQEALITFDRQAWFATAVMLGAAAEKVVYLLAEELKSAVQDAAEKTRIAKVIMERRMPRLFEALTDTLQKAKTKIPYEFQEGITTHLFSFFEAIRVQRNDAVHPVAGKVSPNQVRMTLAAFPQALSTIFGLLNWLGANQI
jgi:hypothetical protein